MNASELPGSADYAFITTFSRILVVDDDAFFRDITIFRLQHAGYRHIESASGGAEAISKLVTFDPQLIVLDLVMPEVDGAECCRQIRASSVEAKAIPILILTGASDPEQYLYAIKAGANGVVSKSAHAHVFVDKVLEHLQHYYLIHSMFQFMGNGADDYLLAHQVQAMLIPSASDLAAVEKTTGVHVEYLFRPAQTIGGDYWGVRTMPDGRAVFYLFDYSGHGLQAAVSALSLHNVLPEILAYQTSPEMVLDTLNAHMCSVLSDGQYGVGILGFIDAPNRKVEFSSSGMNPAVLFSNGAARTLDCSGSPLGVYRDSRFEIQSYAFHQDDALAIYTDALVEPGANGVVPYTREALLRDMGELANNNISEVFEKIAKKAAQHESELEDDLSIVLFSVMKPVSAA